MKLMPAACNCWPQVVAWACRVAGAIVPCTTAVGMREKPGPCIAWMTPPSWLAAMKKRTLPVDALARLQLAARRRGCQVRLRGASDELRGLVGFMGLGAVLPD